VSFIPMNAFGLCVCLTLTLMLPYVEGETVFQSLKWGGRAVVQGPCVPTVLSVMTTNVVSQVDILKVKVSLLR